MQFDDPSGLLTSRRATIDALARATIQRVEAALDLTGVTLVISPDRNRAIAGYGIGGRTGDSRTSEIFIDPSFANLDALLPLRLPPLVAHELHHAKRIRRPGYGATLFEAMISEGMADRFALELLGTPVQPWSDSFPLADNQRWLSLAGAEFDSRSYNHARWFFDVDPSLPRWTGYTLGYRLVEAYLAAHPGTSASALVSEPASTFRP